MLELPRKKLSGYYAKVHQAVLQEFSIVFSPPHKVSLLPKILSVLQEYDSFAVFLLPLP
jgi:hypothetical protein